MWQLILTCGLAYASAGIDKLGSRVPDDLEEFVAVYLSQRPASAGYAEQLRVSVTLFSRFLGRRSRLEDLTPDNANPWIASLEQSKRPATVNGRRRALLTLWRAAHDMKLVALWPHRIRRAKEPEREIDGFSDDDMRRLVEYSETLWGDINGWPIARADYWSSFGRTSWDTAFRLGDMLDMERRDIWPGGRVRICQNKTSQGIVKQLAPDTLAAIERSFARMPGRALIWPLWGRREAWFRAFRKLAEGAGLKGTSKWIRRGSATAVYLATPGLEGQHLGHKTPGLAKKHYLITRLVNDSIVRPPEL